MPAKPCTKPRLLLRNLYPKTNNPRARDQLTQQSVSSWLIDKGFCTNSREKQVFHVFHEEPQDQGVGHCTQLIPRAFFGKTAE